MYRREGKLKENGDARKGSDAVASPKGNDTETEKMDTYPEGNYELY